MVFKKSSIALSELYKRVPSNQMKFFEEFSKKYADYSRRVSKFPETLPVINWDEYKRSVRTEMIPWLEEYQENYNKLNEQFKQRDKLDHSKYYAELETDKQEQKELIEKYIEESNLRIKQIEERIEYLQNLKPYKQMTIEEFCTLQPEKAKYVPYHGNQNLFWPFDSNEQLKDSDTSENS